MHSKLQHIFACALPALLALSGCTGSPGSGNGKANLGESTVVNDRGGQVIDPVTEEQMRQAALDGETARVMSLLEAGVNVDAADQEGHTALMFASFNGHSEIVLALIGEDAQVDRRDLLGRTALLYASTGPFPETVKILLEKGAEPNIVDSEEHFSPLMHAAAEGHMDVVKILLDYGADHTLTDVDNDNAESFARQAGHVQVAEFLHSLDP